MPQKVCIICPIQQYVLAEIYSWLEALMDLHLQKGSPLTEEAIINQSLEGYVLQWYVY